MSLPNNGGGQVHLDRKTSSDYNQDKTSKAMFAIEANEIGNRPEWTHDGLEITLPDGSFEHARQCASTSGRLCLSCGKHIYPQGAKHAGDTLVCPNCDSTELEYQRCEQIAVPGYMTCARHGGGFRPTDKHRAAALRGAIKNGTSFNQILYCPCNMFKATCNYKNLYYDEAGESRCFPEKESYDEIVKYISESYELDGAADMIVLNRLAMAMLRIKRAEKLVAKDGEIVKRSRASNDGSVEEWFEPNSAGSVVDKLDSKLLNWLKSLNVTRQARLAAAPTSLVGVNDIAALLSDTNVDGTTVLELPAGSDDQ